MDPGTSHPKLRELLTLCEAWGGGCVHPLIDFFLNFQNDMMDFHENWGLCTVFA